jgi:hypothetical protein
VRLFGKIFIRLQSDNFLQDFLQNGIGQIINFLP